MQTSAQKSNFIWNMIGSLMYSLNSFILLIVVNRVAGETAGGIFTFAYSHSQLMYYIATLEVRPIQSTDVKEKYPFSSYFSLRITSTIIMILCSIIYVIVEGGGPEKSRIILYLCIYKAIEAVEDLFASLYQQRDCIRYTGMLSTLKVGASMTIFIIILVVSKNLELACIAMIVVSLTVMLTYNVHLWKRFERAEISFHTTDFKEILVASFPLFVSVFVMLYISNAPKYAINDYCTDVIQNKYSILFMPAFVINLFSQFILRPLLTTMARVWNENNIKRFEKDVIKMLKGIALLTLLGLIGAYLLGIPLLSLVYGVNLDGDRMVLMIVMCYGGLNAVNTFLYDMIAVTRQQKWLLVGYIVAALIVMPLSPILVRPYGMMGAITASCIAIGVLDVILSIVVINVIRKKKRSLGGIK